MVADPRDFWLSSYDYELDSKLIAQEPIEPRHNAKMMVLAKKPGETLRSSHLRVWDLLDELKQGDLLVMNDTRVLRARLKVRLKTGAFAELLLLEPKGCGRWLCLGKPAKKMRPGDNLVVEAPGQELLPLEVLETDTKTGGRIIQFPECFSDSEKIERLLEKYGEMPLPPYIHRHGCDDIERYQTRYASKPGAVAAPTAGLHLSDELLQAFSKKGIEQATVTLHVGLGTFRPLEDENLSNLRLHKEWVEVTEKLVLAIQDCRSRGGRVIAIGTTTVRSLESAFIFGQGTLKPFQGPVDLVIKPGHKFGVVDGLLTNFHLPKSSLLLLVSALIGRKELLSFYQEAKQAKYRFFSYGDAMYISPEAVLTSARF